VGCGGYAGSALLKRERRRRSRLLAVGRAQRKGHSEQRKGKKADSKPD